MKRGILILLSLLLLAEFVHAGFSAGNASEGIQANYASSDLVKGWINISLDREDSSSLFEDNFGNSISLKKLLEINPNYDYDCAPNDCENGYSLSNSQTFKALSMGKNQEKILGLKLSGSNFESVSSFSMRISSSVPESSSKQLFMDILNDDSAEWQPYKASNNFGNENYGCYENSTEQPLIYVEDYCEKINIPVSPKVEIGAYVVKNSTENATFILSLEGNASSTSASCEVTATATGRISCVPNAKIDANEDFFVCIRAKSSSDSNKFRIDSETQSPCGYASSPENKRDFRIFAKPGRFAPIGSFFLNSSESQNSGGESSIEDYVTNYIIDKYGNNCSNGCIVPLRVISQAEGHDINISEISVFYVAGGTPKEEKNIYDASEIPAKISSGFQKLSLDKANFSVAGTPKENKTYSLDLKGLEIFSKAISFDQGITILSLVPKTVVAGFPTKFTATTSNPGNLSPIQYEWNFGSNDTLKTSENTITYTYKTIGSFQLTLKTTDPNGVGASKSFAINVKTPKNAVNSLLAEKLADLSGVNSRLGALPEFQRSLLRKALDMGKTEGDLASLQQRNSTAQTDDDYVKIMDDLVAVNVPKSVFESGKAESVSFSTNMDSINLDILKEIGSGGSYEPGEKEIYEDAIVLWGIENADSEISFEEFSAQYEDSIAPVLKTFNIKISENQERGNFYLIIRNMENLEFKENYGQREALGYYYVKMDGQEQMIEFSTTEDVSFRDLPVFFSPEFRDLSVVSLDKITAFEDKAMKILIIVALFAAIAGFVAYIILQEWYKRKYEDYLFRDKNNLLNIVSYIQGSKKKGALNEEIEKGLKKAGWSSEQVTYVMKKYAGERTGMFEIPVGKILSLFSKGQEEAFKPVKNP
jgi:hypothetical protein